MGAAAKHTVPRAANPTDICEIWLGVSPFQTARTAKDFAQAELRALSGRRFRGVAEGSASVTSATIGNG